MDGKEHNLKPLLYKQYLIFNKITRLAKQNKTKKIGPNDQYTREKIDNWSKFLGNLNTGNSKQKFYNIYVYFCSC